MACAFCQAMPGARVVGIDPLPRAIELAAATVARRGLGGRVQLRCQGVEELIDEEAFGLAGGWLLLPAAAVEPGAGGEDALCGGMLLR